MVNTKRSRKRQVNSSRLRLRSHGRQIIVKQIGHVVGASSMGLLMLVMAMLLVPSVNAVYAENTDSVTTAVNARIRPSISLSAPSSLNLELMPDLESEFTSTSGIVTVTTNNASGFRLLLQSTNTNTLVSHDNASTNTSDVITSISNATTPNNFNDNTWGYYLGEAAVSDTTSYQPVSTIATEALKTDTSSTDTGSLNQYNLAFGTKVSNTLPAGTYSNSVIISAVANPLEIHSLSDLTFMQDMTTSICAETPSAYNSTTGTTDKTSEYYTNPVTKQLIDIRDGKSYWVAKLADGNCWMTQNLALDLSTDRTLTVVNTDLENVPKNDDGSDYEFTPTENTSLAIPSPSTGVSTSTKSWNLGQLVLLQPTVAKACPQAQIPDNGHTYPTNSQYNSAFTDQLISENCPERFKDVSGWKVFNEIVASDQTVNEEAKLYDAHYSVGNYYDRSAATAATNISSRRQEATAPDGNKLYNASGSICPKGWKLPQSGRYANKSDEMYGQSFNLDDSPYRLMIAYGYSQEKWPVSGSGVSYINILSNADPTAGPMYYVRSGRLDMQRGSLWAAGYDSIYATSTNKDESNLAYYLFLASTILPSDAFSGFVGQSIRCLAR